MKLHEFQMEVGKLGEIYVYEYEKEKLNKTKYVDLIDRTKAFDPINGYDILSFNKDGSELYIEVKATTGTEGIFYISSHELETYKRMLTEKKCYKVYLVTNILCQDPQLLIIDKILEDERVEFVEQSWKVNLK